MTNKKLGLLLLPLIPLSAFGIVEVAGRISPSSPAIESCDVTSAPVERPTISSIPAPAPVAPPVVVAPEPPMPAPSR